MEQQSRKIFLINTLYFVTVAVGIFIFCRFLLKYLMPFIAGGAVALIVQKPAGFISAKTKIKRSVIAGTLAVSAFVGFALLCFFLCFKAVSSAAGFFEEIGGNADKLTALFKDIKSFALSLFEKLPKEINGFLTDLYGSALDKAAASFTAFISSAAGYAVKRAPQFLLSFTVAAVSSCYIAADFNKLINFARGIIGKRIYADIIRVKNIMVNSVFKFIKGYLIILAITFAELFLGLMFLKIKYALILSALIAVIDVLPVLGTGTVLIPWAALELITGDTAKGLSIAALYILITAVRNFAEPKIIGRQIGIKPLFTLLAMFIGIRLFGIAGIFILPITLIVLVEYYKQDNSELVSDKS